MEVSERGSDGVWYCRAGGMSSARMGKAEDAGVGKPKFPLCTSPHPCSFRRMLDPSLWWSLFLHHQAALGKSYSTQASHDSGWGMLGLGMV